MKVTNVSGVARFIPAANVTVADGEAFEVAEDLGKSLLEQPANWAVATSKPAKTEE